MATVRGREGQYGHVRPGRYDLLSLLADPGFDCLFLLDIAGFPSAFRSANFQMAIRADAPGLPAVIGAGEVLYAGSLSGFRHSLDGGDRQAGVWR